MQSEPLPEKRPLKLIAVCLIGIFLCLLFPADPAKFRSGANETPPAWATLTDSQLRFANTAAQIGLPLLLQDKAGLVQLAYLAVTATFATHGLKWLVDDVTVSGVRLGERPYSPDSRHNMPSGHSSMASCAAYFVARRYGWRHLLYLAPITLLTMAARVFLDAHSLTAVIAGCLIGIACAAWWTQPLRKQPSQPQDGSPLPPESRI